MTNKLTLAIEQSGLESNKADNLMKTFGGFYQEAKAIVEEYETLKVISVDDIELMQEARQARFKLRDIRVEADKTRKKLKEQSTREGKAIQGVYNIIDFLVKPVEKHLLEQEKFAEYKEAERLLKQENDRIVKLSVYVEDVSLYRLREMSDEAFEHLLSGLKLAYEAQKKAEADAEKAQIEKKKQEVVYSNRKWVLAPYSSFIDLSKLNIDTNQTDYEEMVSMAKESKSTYIKNQEKIRLENEKLKKAQEAEKLAKQKESDARDKKDAKLKAENEKKMKIANEAKEKAEAELQKKRDAEKLEKARKIIEDKAIADAKAKAEQKALLAPDKQKLIKVKDNITFIEWPNLKSKEAQYICEVTMKKLQKVVEELQEEIKKL